MAIRRTQLSRPSEHAVGEEREDNIVPVESDHYFTINALYRLGFKWPIVDDAYLEKVISAVESLEFFHNL